MSEIVRKRIKQLRDTFDDDDTLAVCDAAEEHLDELGAHPAQLSAEETSSLRGWAERAAVRPKTDRSRWVAQMVLRLLRENFNLRKRNNN